MAHVIQHNSITGAQYRPLAPGEVRLLKPKSTGDLSYSFVYVNILSSQAYVALSYTWGTPEFPCRITIDGRSVPVTANLYDALQVITNLSVQDESLDVVKPHLWVDAVCVNQADLEERSSQVRLMKILYEKAEKIYVWLGKPEDEGIVALAAAKMRQLESRMMTNTKDRSIDKEAPINLEADFLNGLSTTDKVIWDGPDTPTYRSWLGVCALWKRSWWNRTWVYQEATVPENLQTHISRKGPTHIVPHKSKVLFISGSSTITWFQFYVTMRVARYLENQLNPNMAILKDSTNLFHSIWDLRIYRSRWPRLTLLELLQFFRGSDCTDPRDKVYAPLGLATESATSMIIPDYRKPILEVYADVVNYQLQQKRHELDFLGYTMRLDRSIRPLPDAVADSNWPSWLPQWYEPLDFEPLPKNLRHQNDLEVKPVRPSTKQANPDQTQRQTKAYNATGDLEPAVSVAGASLHVEAIMCEALGDFLDFKWPLADIKETSTRWGVEAKGIYWTGESMEETMARTTTADLMYNFQGEPCGRNGFKEYVLLRGKPPDQLTAREREVQVAQTNARTRAVHFRKVCRTRNHLIGLVPMTAMAGDEICAIVGSQVLHVVRKVDEGSARLGYSYIGESYIHGLMDGEVMERVKDERASVVHIVLT